MNLVFEGLSWGEFQGAVKFINEKREELDRTMDVQYDVVYQHEDMTFMFTFQYNEIEEVRVIKND